MASKIVVVGIGPGHPDYVPPIASRAIRAAQVLIGSRRALATFADSSQIQVEITGALSAVVDVIRQHREIRPVTVMVSGDPGFYSLLSYLLEHFRPAELDIIPGIGSMQMAFCRAKTVWQDARLVSLHGRRLENVADLLVTPCKIGFLTDSQHCPAVIANYLLNLGWPNCTVYLCEKLSYPDERVVQTDLYAATHEVGFAHGIMVVMEHA
jgi:cobalt-precorrin-7 (C5)-methyltransferase